MISPQALSVREYFDCLTRHLSDRFVYDEAAADTVKEPAAALRPEALAILSEELRRELSDALASLDATRGGGAYLPYYRAESGTGRRVGASCYTTILHAVKADTNNSTGKATS